MITYVVSDLLQSPARVLVNTVNTVGVMGKGIAKDFKRIYPEMFKEYQYFCETKQLEVDIENAVRILESHELLSRTEAEARGLMKTDNASPEVKFGAVEITV